MNTNTNKLKTTLTALSLITASYLQSQQHAATQNEAQFTAVDPEGFDDNLYGAGMCAIWKKLAEQRRLPYKPLSSACMSLSGGYANLDGA